MKPQTWKPKRRPSHLLNGIDFWAFPAVQVALLMVFMAGMMTPHRPVRPTVDLTRTSNAKSLPSAGKEDAIIIAITRDGDVFFRNLQVRVQDLNGHIRQAVRDGAEPKIYIKADARAKYGDVAAVVQAVRGSEVHNFAFLTEQLETYSQIP